MKVLFDISFCAGIHASNGLRAGSFQFVEGLATALSRLPADQLTIELTAQGNYYGAIAYLRECEALGHLPIHQPPYLGYREILSPLIQKGDWPVRHSRVSAFRLLLFRAALRYSHSILKEISLPISSKSFPGAQVFHSPLEAPCEQVMKRHKLAKVVTVQDIIPIKFPQYFSRDSEAQGVRNVLKAASEGGAWVHCVSEATRQDVLEHLPKLPPERVFVARTGVRDSLCAHSSTAPAAETLARYGLRPGEPYFLSVCTLEPRKNLSRLVAAFELLARERGPSWTAKLVLVGGAGWLQDKLTEALAAHKEIRERVLLTGFVPDEDLGVLYSGARAFAYPSLYEGFGLPVIEAMRLGAPVITSNVSSLPEAAGGAALLVNPRSIEELAAALSTMETDEAARNRAITQGHEWSKQFTPAACAEAVYAGYQRAAS